MTVKCFTNQEKQAVIRQYQAKEHTLKEQAQFWGCSARTIGRILEEAGLATPVPRLQGEAHQVMQILAKFKIATAKDLQEFLKRELIHDTKPAALSKDQVQTFLNSCPKADLINLFYQAGLHRLADAKPEEVSNAKPITADDEAFPLAA